MESGERLAAYLAGELDAEQTQAVEAALARDPALRARLASIAATDELLASLPEVDVPADFSERLRAAVATELDTQLDEGSGQGSGEARDDLAARRERRPQRPGGSGPRRSWLPQIAVAAAVLAFGGIGIGLLSGGMGGDDAEQQADAGAAPEMGTMEALAVPEESQGAPVVVAQGRSLDANSLAALADQPDLRAVLEQNLTEMDASILADERQEQFGARATDADAATGDGTADDTDAGGRRAPEPAAGDEAALRTIGDVSEEDLEAVRTCLPSLLEAQTAVIPVYAEIVTFEGQDAIVYGLVGHEPVREEYRRVELWVVGRGDCQVIHFAQVDR